MNFPDLPIRRKLMWILLLTSGSVLILTSAAFVAYEWFHFRETMVRNMSTIAEIVADNSTASLAFANEKDAREVLASLKAERYVSAAALYTADGKLFAKYPDSVSSREIPSRPQKFGYRFEQRYLNVYQPVREGDRLQGILYLRTDLRAINDRLKLYAGIVLLVLLFSFLVAFALAASLQKRISDPVLALAETAKTVSEKQDYSVRARPPVSHDELGILTNAFNHMLTQIHQREVALRESEERLNLALRSSGVGTWNWDLIAGKITWDDYVPALFGLKPGMFSGKFEDFEQLVVAEDRPKLRQITEHSVTTLSGFELEMRVVWPDGSIHVLASKGKAYADENERPVRLTGVCFDVSDRKAAEEALRSVAEELARSNSELEQFAYVASHDLQEPLRAVAGCVQLLEKRYANKLDEHADELIQHTVDAASRMQKLIRDLLTYSRAGGQKDLQMQDTAEILSDVLRDLQSSIKKSGATVQYNGLPQLAVDRTQMAQLFQNLIANAIKFTPGRQPVITVGANRNGHEWVFYVRDNGIGIEPAFRDRIFLLFQRLHTRREYPGTGIGLAICKKIVERRGGKIWIESEPGSGSTFYFSIPDIGGTYGG